LQSILCANDPMTQKIQLGSSQTQAKKEKETEV